MNFDNDGVSSRFKMNIRIDTTLKTTICDTSVESLCWGVGSTSFILPFHMCGSMLANRIQSSPSSLTFSSLYELISKAINRHDS